MTQVMKPEDDVMTRKTLTRSDLRAATIHGVARVKSEPRRLRLTSGQRANIVRKSK